MFRHALAPVLLLLMLSFARGQENTNAIPSIESAIRAKRFDEALSIAKSALNQRPGDFRVWTLQGIAYSLKGDSPAALAAFRKALALSPGYPAALRGEAQLLYQAGDKRASAVLQTIVKTDPEDRTAQEMLAVIEAKQNDCSGALEHFRLSKDAIGSHPDSLERYGYCLVRLKQFEQAISVFEQLVALLPDRPLRAIRFGAGTNDGRSRLGCGSGAKAAHRGEYDGSRYLKPCIRSGREYRRHS